jgi:hypothetical protein
MTTLLGSLLGIPSKLEFFLASFLSQFTLPSRVMAVFTSRLCSKIPSGGNMNSRRLRTWLYLGALLLPAMVLSVSATQKNSQALHTPTACPAGIGALSADGTAPPPTIPPKKGGKISAWRLPS